MARLEASFDATAHDTEQNDYPELPNGIYDLEVIASDVVPTKAGNGTILKATMTVVRPIDFEGRKVFNNYNIMNPSTVAQEIGQRQFASLCRAVRLPRVDDSEELHGRTFRVKIGLGKPSKDGQYPARAEIERYYFDSDSDVPEPGIDDNQPAPKAANDNKPAARPQAQQPQQAAPGGAKRPWGK